MATRMQQRRGNASQWTSANPILNIGEIGFETDTNQFKIGDGVNHWADLSYFVDETFLNTSLDNYVETSLLGVANGVATLNSSGKLESSQVPNIDELAQDAVDSALVAGSGITKVYNDNANTITVGIDSTVVTTLTGTQTLTNKSIDLANNTVSGTIAQFNTALSDADFATLSGSETLSNKSLGNSVTLGANLNASTYTITNLGAPVNTTDAATKSYVDAVAEGLHIHQSAVAATTTNINISTQLEAGDILDGVTLAEGDRVLVKNQTNSAQNGIYIVQSSGAALRASDFNEPQEVDGGDFIFVTGGTVNDNTGWVQTTTNVVTIGTDPIVFTQFAGSGTYTAGNGLSLNGTEFSINTSITADLSSAQTLLNKSINLANNTVSGTLAQFNTALSDADFATLAGTETLSGKTLSNVIISGTLTANNVVGDNGQYLKTTGSGVVWDTVESLPSQTGNNGKYLTTNGTAASWAAVSSDPISDIFLLMGA